MTKFSEEVEHANELVPLLEKAFDIIMTEPPGPVHISIPVDLYNKEIIYQKLRNISEFPIPKIIRLYDQFTPDDLQKARDLIAHSNCPLCLIGQEVIRLDIHDDVRSFCEVLNIQTISSANAQGIFPREHDLNLGSASPYMEGILGYPALEEIFKDVDLLICIGYQYADDLLPKMWAYGEEKQSCFYPALK
ncbi:MAG: thiamine pyrophosphate-binding protein [Chitinophagaceae bacterium]|nr:thiamine pyrophosphate-binding protein [Chitinophagaceae bacterium]